MADSSDFEKKIEDLHEDLIPDLLKAISSLESKLDRILMILGGLGAISLAFGNGLIPRATEHPSTPNSQSHSQQRVVRAVEFERPFYERLD